MQTTIRNLPMILHPYASVSNGSSILAPRRIELYPKQPIAQETGDFVNQLVIHELRHFAQMERLNGGFTRIASYLLGDQAQSLVLGIHVPKWLLEGDAVLTETLLSEGGRGRMAGFIAPLRSRLLDNKDLSWDRVLFGSYNEAMPNEYLFGYFLTARGRMLADPLLWSDAMGKIGRNPFNINGLSGLTRPKTGYRFSKLYVETLEWLNDFWTDPSLAVKMPENLITLTHDSLAYLNYYWPQQVSDHEVICLKKSIADLPAFVIIDSAGNEKLVARPGPIEDSRFTYLKGTLYWSELITDSRWQNRIWSDLFSFTINTGIKTRLTHGKRYFAPVFSPAGDRIAVIEEQPDGSSFVKIVNPADGNILKSVPATPADDHFSYVCWGSIPGEIIAVTTGSSGKKLIRIDLEKGLQEVILDAGYSDIASPSVSGTWVYFSGPVGASQGLYRADVNSHRIEIVFAHPHGINYLTVQGTDMLLSVFSGNGYRPARISIASLNGQDVQRIEPLIEPVTSIIQRAQGEFPVKVSEAASPENIKPYRKSDHLFNLHSWSPIFLNPDSYQISPGMVLMSQNELSTMTCWGGYQYSKPDQSHNLIASLSYTGWYPTLDIDYNRKYWHTEGEMDSTGNQKWKFPLANRQHVHVASALPLSYSSGAWSRRIQPAIFFELANELSQRNEEFNGSTWMTGVSLYLSVLRKMSFRDLFPKWGLSVRMNAFKSFDQSGWANNMNGRVMLYLPGLLPNSSLRVLNSANLMKVDQFNNSIEDSPRGQVIFHSPRSYNFKVDYSFPVSYPDYHLSWLVYVKRIKADLFFDAGTLLDKVDWFLSTGLDVTLDYHLLRSGIFLESGIRMMYFPASRKVGAEFLFAFSIN